jgi:holo-[acyl-carrier protein] synthase
MSSSKSSWGVGTDILEIERIREVISREGEAFIKRIFTPQEQAYCQKYKDPMPQFAARFSAKESIVKALGCGVGEKIGWQDIEISHDKAGKPIVAFSAKINKRFNNPQVILSMSHCRDYVSTVALLLP